jgi:regulator of replication initiation timing
MSISTIGGWLPWTTDEPNVNRLSSQVDDLSRQLNEIKGENGGTGATVPSFKKENDDLKKRLAASTMKVNELSRANTTLIAQKDDDLAKIKDEESRLDLCNFTNTKAQVRSAP